MGSLTVEVTKGAGTDYMVNARIHDNAADEEFMHLMCAAEYLSYLVATKSNLGFEAALDKIAAGAITWRTLKAEEQADAD